ncbi:peroxisomal sarcosine oxidase-like isoform X1 [Branchiostoma lanceolatum]|uniref:peroxisomal sarcosine oxidase-like isoform X1 n=2 Tax=Branchiostoma lanceolatum TaxID=7740 RepID=UPI003457231F
MSDPGVWDCVVVGAGVMGSACGLQLVQNGVTTLLLEQFCLPHSRGSSWGQTRATRKSYKQEHYARMAAESNKLWRQVETESGTKLTVDCRQLAWGRPDNPILQDIHTNLHKVGVQSKVLTNQDLRHQFPMLRFPGNYVGVTEAGAGLIKADQAVRALQDLFVQKGGCLKDGEAVTGITPGPTVSVITSKRKIRTRRLVLTCGPWAGKLLSNLGLDLPLETLRVNVCYWKEKVPSAYSLLSDFPVIKDEDTEVYGLPCFEYPDMMKICRHTGHPADPDNRDTNMQADLKFDLQFLGDFVRRHFPGLHDKPGIVETCMYTNTPDGEYILDRHPKHRNIVIGAGFSGHGFKLAPMVGRLLCELTLDKSPSLDMTPFRIDRFTSRKAISKL